MIKYFERLAECTKVEHIHTRIVLVECRKPQEKIAPHLDSARKIIYKITLLKPVRIELSRQPNKHS